jgi:ABC-type glycerol-3-phosphate transport system permease component
LVGKSNARNLGIVIAYVILIALLFFALAPVALMIGTAFKPNVEIFQVPPRWLPRAPTLSNFHKVIFNSGIPHYAFNSIIIATLMTFTALVLGTLAGYGFSRFKFRGNRALSLFMLLGQLIPLIALIVPFFQIFDAVGLLDTKMGIALAHLTTALPLVTWMSASYFSTIPVELDEAAIIDGCTRMQALRKVVLPVALPGIISIALFAFLMSWNEFVLASVLTNTDNSKTLPIGLSEFATMFTVDWGSTMAAAFLMTVPVVAVFLLFQKQFVSGLSAGAVKG